MSSRRSRSGGRSQLHHRQPEEEVLAELAALDLEPQVALAGREHADVDAQLLAAAHAPDACASRARAAAWAAGRAAARRPRRGTACRRGPARRRPRAGSTAPVKAPFSWPNSSLSISEPDDRAAVDDDERARLARGCAGGARARARPCRCRSRRRSARWRRSGAMRSRSPKSSRMRRERPTTSPKLLALARHRLDALGEGAQLELDAADASARCPGAGRPRGSRRRRAGCRWSSPGRAPGSPRRRARSRSVRG